MSQYAAIESPMARNALLIYYALACPRPHPLVLTGNPGIGKTEFLRTVGREVGVDDDHFLRWSVGQHEPADFNGWAVPRADGLYFVPTRRLIGINDGKPAIWLQDELNLATGAGQGAMLKTWDERLVGDEMLNRAVRIVGAMNPPGTASDAHPITKPLSNRAGWVPFFSPNKADFAAYQRGQAFPPGLVFQPITVEAWGEWRARVAGIHNEFMKVSGVLEENPEDEAVQQRFEAMPDEDGRKVFQPAYATPRSHNMMLDFVATALVCDDWPAALILAAGTVGRPQARLFIEFAKKMDLLSPAEAILHPEKFAVDPRRTDRTFAQLDAVARYCTSESHAKKEANEIWHGGWDFIKSLRTRGVARDILIPAAQSLGHHRPKGQLLRNKDIIEELAPMVFASLIGDTAQGK